MITRLTFLFSALAIVTFLGSQVAVSAQAGAPAIAFGSKHAVALRTNGDVLTWGNNVFCGLGRPSGNRSATPDVVLRNIKEIAAAEAHSLALSTDGKVYGWGANDRGELGTGNTIALCEGPALVASLADKTVAHIATGLAFSLAVTTSGDLYCTGDNDMGQCPAAAGSSTNSFRLMTNPELAGNVAAVRAGAFHALVLTKDGKLYTFGRGREGQLGNGRNTNGFTLVPDLTDVVSFAAGTWHSVAARADGSVWIWGRNQKSQLCDGTTVDRSVPAKVTLPAAVKITQVTAGWQDTMMRAGDGAIYVCGDNQFGSLGTNQSPIVPAPALVAPASTATVLAVGGYASAFSPDGCAVRIAGDNDDGVVSATGGPASGPFAVRANLSLCAPRPATALPTIVREAPRGGASGCWTPRVQEDAAGSVAFAGLRQAMLAAENLLKQNAAFLAAPVPVRFRTAMSAGPSNDGGARLHVKVAPERKGDGARLWTGDCDVIPQIDRIGGAIAQVSVFFNTDAGGQFIGSNGEAPKLTGHVAGFPEYNNWILITTNGRVPWIPQTLADKLDAEGARRKTKLEEWMRTRAGMKVQDAASVQKTYDLLKKSDPAGADKYLVSMKETTDEMTRLQRDVYPATTAQLEKEVRDYEKYRASFTAAQLQSPAVWGDASGQAKRELDAKIASLQALTPDEQRQADELTRSQAPDRQVRVRTLRQRHLERASPLMDDATAQYQLANLQPGPADRAMSVKRDPTFPDTSTPNRIQIITVSFSVDPDPAQTARREWQQRFKASFDFAALAALLK